MMGVDNSVILILRKVDEAPPASFAHRVEHQTGCASTDCGSRLATYRNMKGATRCLKTIHPKIIHFGIASIAAISWRPRLALRLRSRPIRMLQARSPRRHHEERFTREMSST